MKTKSFPPAPEEVLNDLLPLFHCYLELGLLFGLDQAKKYFEDYRAPRDPWLFSNIVRFQMKQWLLKNEVGELGFKVLNPPLTGIWLQNDRYKIRVWKEDWVLDPETHEPVSRLGGPSASEARKDFFYQPHLEFEVAEGDLGDPSKFEPTKLIATWDVDQLGRPTPFQLICPSRFDDDLRKALIHWRAAVPPSSDTLPEPGSLDIVSEAADLLEELKFGTEDTASGGDDADPR